MKRRLAIAFIALALSVSMFTLGYWFAGKRYGQALDIFTGYMNNSLGKIAVVNARMDGVVLEHLLKNDPKRATEILQKTYYEQILNLDHLEFRDNIYPESEGSILRLGKLEGGVLQSEAKSAYVEARERLIRYPYQLPDASGSDRLEKLRAGQLNLHTAQ